MDEKERTFFLSKIDWVYDFETTAPLLYIAIAWTFSDLTSDLEGRQGLEANC